MMVPLRIKAPDWVRKAVDAPHRSTAFRHATLHGRPGLWGDDPWHPTSAVWLREGDEGAWEAFGAGRASPAIGWLASRAEGRPIALLAPPSWEGPIRIMGGRVESGMIQTRLRPEAEALPMVPDRVAVRALTLEDGPAFEADVPPWALRSWGDFGSLITHGAAFGVPTADGFASLAWTYESDQEHDKIGVATRSRYQRLGLGRAVASALILQSLRDRRKSPLWVTTRENRASTALADSLGFSIVVEEKWLRWTPNHQAPPGL